MTKFYFDIRRGHEVIRDEEGGDLPDLPAAEEEALALTRELVIERLRWNQAVGEDAVLQRDDAGRVLNQIPLRSVVR